MALKALDLHLQDICAYLPVLLGTLRISPKLCHHPIDVWCVVRLEEKFTNRSIGIVRLPVTECGTG